MIDIQQDYEGLSAVTNAYGKLKEKFDEFALHLEAEAGDPTARIKGFNVQLSLGQRFFVVELCDRTITFEFTTCFWDTGTKPGKVTCYQAKRFPKPEQVEVEHFTFDQRGVTDQAASPHNDLMCMDQRGDAVTLVWHFVAKSFTN